MSSLSEASRWPNPREGDHTSSISASAEASLDPVLLNHTQCQALCALLTPKEREIVEQVAAGLADKEIAVRLQSSEHTVHNHLKHILAKLRCPNRTAAAVTFARGLWEPNEGSGV